jgi:hypothetical protein
MATNTFKGIAFWNAQAYLKKYPSDTEIPTEEELDFLRVGDYVMVRTVQDRIWGSVTEIDGDMVSIEVKVQLTGEDTRKATHISCHKKNIVELLWHESRISYCRINGVLTMTIHETGENRRVGSED